LGYGDVMKSLIVARKAYGVPDIVAVLEEEIALGQLAPRERLVEEEIADRFGVKRHVVRQALADLETMGIVVHQPNRGAAVRDYGVDEVEQLYLVRALIERRAAELMPLPAGRAILKDLQKIQNLHAAAAEKGDLRTVFRENLLFHRTFFSLCGNVPLMEIIEQMALKTHAIRSYSIGDPSLLKVVREQHQRMIDLLSTRDRKGLVDVVVQHIQPAKDAYLRLARHTR
jgi:DNA-binding GntR family transcriptional regulator